VPHRRTPLQTSLLASVSSSGRRNHRRSSSFFRARRLQHRPVKSHLRRGAVVVIGQVKHQAPRLQQFGRGLTRRSSADPLRHRTGPARPSLSIIGLAGPVRCRSGPLSSNVRPRRESYLAWQQNQRLAACIKQPRNCNVSGGQQRTWPRRREPERCVGLSSTEPRQVTSVAHRCSSLRTSFSAFSQCFGPPRPSS